MILVIFSLNIVSAFIIILPFIQLKTVFLSILLSDYDVCELKTQFWAYSLKILSVCKQNTLFTDTYLTAESLT